MMFLHLNLIIGHFNYLSQQDIRTIVGRSFWYTIMSL